MIFLEVKNAKGKLRDVQQNFAETIKNYPVIYGVPRSAADAVKIVLEDK